MNQLLVQAAGFAVGLYLVRELSQHDYALYALMVAFVAGMSVVIDSGISSTTVSLSAEHAPGSPHVLRIARMYARRLTALVAVACIPALWLLLSQNGLGPFDATVIALLATVGAYFNVHFLIDSGSLRATLNFDDVRRTNSIATLYRVVLVGMMLPLPFLALVWAAFTNSSSYALQSLLARLRCSSRKYTEEAHIGAGVDGYQDHAPRYRAAIKGTFLVNVGLVVQSQAIYPFLAGFGATDVLARLAAVARYGIVAQILASIFLGVAEAYVARARSSVLRTYLFVLTLAAVGLLGPIAGALLFEHELLSLLGQEYLDSGNMMLIIVAGSSTSALAMIMGGLNGARGWLGHQAWYFAGLILWLLAMATLVDPTSTIGASLVLGSSGIPVLLLQSRRLLFGARQQRVNRERAVHELPNL